APRRCPRPPIPALPPRQPARPARTDRPRSLVLLEPQTLVMQPVAELIPLGGQIPPVLRMRRHLDRHLLGHLQPVRAQARDLLRVVRQQADGGEAELAEDLVADPPLPFVGAEAEREAGVDRVVAALMQLVPLQLVEEPDAAPLLRHV